MQETTPQAPLPTSTDPRRSHRRTEWIAAACATVAYLNALPNDFCHDDVPIVRSSELVNAEGRWGAIWTTDYWAQTRDDWPNRDLLYRPIAVTSYRAVRAFCGPSALPQHFVNLALHALISILVVRIARRVGLTAGPALLSGLLFAVLPIHTEAVCAIVGRADLLVTLAVLTAMLAHARSLHTAPRISRVFAAAAAFVALGAKENGLTVLPLVVLLDAFVHHQRRYADPTAPRWWHWTTATRLTYLLLPLIAYLSLRYLALGGELHQRPPLTKAVNVLVDAPLWQHTLGVLQLVGLYATKTLWPSLLCINHSINAVRLPTHFLDAQVLPGIFFAVALLGACLAALRRRSYAVPLLVALLLVSYLPTSNALMLLQVYFAERTWYLPSVWACILLTAGLSRSMPQPALRAVVLLILLAMTARCWFRSGEWRNNGVLYAAAYRDQPAAVGVLHLYGQWLVVNGESRQGLELLGRAVDIDPGYTDAHRALGQAHLHAGDFQNAVRHLQIALMQAPGHPPTTAAFERATRGLLRTQGDHLTELQRAADQRPDNPDAQLAYIRALRDAGHTDPALQRLAAADERFTSVSKWQLEYAVTLVYLDRRDEAIARYERATSLAPGGPSSAVELAMLLLERREGDDLEHAWRLCETAAQSAPDEPAVLICRAELLALRGDVSAAIDAYHQAVQRSPPGSAQRRMLEERVKALGG